MFTKIWDWLRYKFIDRYHCIDTRLPPGWHDADQKLLWASFSILEDVILKERYFEWWNNTEIVPKVCPVYVGDTEFESFENIATRNRIHQEILDLYNWWVSYKVWYHKDDWTLYFFNIPHATIFEGVELTETGIKDNETTWSVDGIMLRWFEISQLAEEKLRIEEDRMLCRLVAVRHYLWT